MHASDPLACAVFLTCAFVVAGAAQIAWFAAPLSRRFAVPLDGGATFRGRRIFGDHKTIRGFVAMVPAGALAFVLVAHAAGSPAIKGLWPLGGDGYAILGALAAFGFMAGELPNSFVKRQLGIDPGGAAMSAWGRVLQVAADRLDSALGMLSAISLHVSVPAATWALVLLVGPILHWGFSVVMFLFGQKARPA